MRAPLTVVLIGLLLVACGGEEAKQEGAGKSPEPATPPAVEKKVETETVTLDVTGMT